MEASTLDQYIPGKNWNNRVVGAKLSGKLFEKPIFGLSKPEVRQEELISDCQKIYVADPGSTSLLVMLTRRAGTRTIRKPRASNSPIF